MARAQKIFATVALGACVTVGGAACSNGGNGSGDGGSEGGGVSEGGENFNLDEADREGGVVFGLGVLPELTLDPADVADTTDLTVLRPLYGTLLRQSPEGEVQPFLAESYEIVDDTTIDVTIREGVTFTDGSALNAEAARQNLIRMRDLNSPELNAILQELDSAEAQDETSLRLSLASPVAGEFLAVLYGPESLMVAPSALDGDTDLKTEAVGAGPYELANYRQNQRVVLERRDDYWDADSYPLKTIEIRQVEDGNPTVTALASGDIEMANSELDTVVRSLRENENIEVIGTAGQRLFYANYCKDRPPFDDPDVRRAFSMSIDRQAIVDTVTAGEGEATSTIFPEDAPERNNDITIEHDPEAAQELLGDRDVTVKLGYYGFVPLHARVTEVAQAQLEEGGFTIELDPAENPEGPFSPDHDALIMGSSLQGVQRVARQLGPDSLPNLCEYSSEDFNSQIDTLERLDPNSEEAREGWREMAQFIYDDELFSPMLFSANFTAFNTDAVNTTTFGRPDVDWRYVYAK